MEKGLYGMGKGLQGIFWGFQGERGNNYELPIIIPIPMFRYERITRVEEREGIMNYEL